MNDEIAQHLQNHDVRPTAVRIMIWKTLRDFDYAFPMADLEGLLPTVDRSTIFRALTLFVDHDLLHTLDDGSGEKKYCICLEHQHCDDEVSRWFMLASSSRTLPARPPHLLGLRQDLLPEKRKNPRGTCT